MGVVCVSVELVGGEERQVQFLCDFCFIIIGPVQLILFVYRLESVVCYVLLVSEIIIGQVFSLGFDKNAFELESRVG